MSGFTEFTEEKVSPVLFVRGRLKGLSREAGVLISAPVARNNP
jgi:hypothetical protein